MYNARFVSDDDTKFYFGYESGTIFDISPLSEVDVEISTAQGFRQTGTTVEAEAVEGISREIKGVFINGADTILPKEMIDIFAPGVHGKLYYNDDYYCECVVEKTPAMTLSNRKRTFELMLYCPYPYWLSVTDSTSQIGGYTAAFSFPVCYDSHIFGIVNDSLMTDVYNGGNAERPISVRFSCLTEVSNYGIENVETDEFLKLNDTLSIGEVVNVYWDDGRLKVEKTVDGVTSNIFSLLDEDSTLFYAAVGSNIFQQFADESTDQLIAYVTITEATAGMVADV